MWLLWKVRVFNRTTKSFTNRNLALNTANLDPVQRLAVELIDETKGMTANHEFLRFRRLFTENSFEEMPSDRGGLGRVHSFAVAEYFEDENGNQITLDDIAKLRSGSSSVMVIPNGASQHDIDLMLANAGPMPIDSIGLSEIEFECLSVFCRDIGELNNVAFLSDGPGTYSTGGHGPSLTTSATDEEIRSFLTVFRRLYMEKEPANFFKAADVFIKVIGSHPRATWMNGEADEIKRQLHDVPDRTLFIERNNVTFTIKRLIDVFLYTRYAHQPDAKRNRQFDECLAQVHGNRDLLMWMFLTEIWKLALSIRNGGRVVHHWFWHYCKFHNRSPILTPVAVEHVGIGQTEKPHIKRSRLFEEKAEKIALELWQKNGKPDGGPSEFLEMARQQLAEVLNAPS